MKQMLIKNEWREKKMKNLKKIALAMALMATIFNHCEVLAAEKNISQEEVQVFDSGEKSQKNCRQKK